MPKLFLRLFCLILIPCLLVEPALTVGLNRSFSVKTSPSAVVPTCLTGQALASVAGPFGNSSLGRAPRRFFRVAAMVAVGVAFSLTIDYRSWILTFWSALPYAGLAAMAFSRGSSWASYQDMRDALDVDLPEPAPENRFEGLGPLAGMAGTIPNWDSVNPRRLISDLLENLELRKAIGESFIEKLNLYREQLHAMTDADLMDAVNVKAETFPSALSDLRSLSVWSRDRYQIMNSLGNAAAPIVLDQWNLDHRHTEEEKESIHERLRSSYELEALLEAVLNRWEAASKRSQGLLPHLSPAPRRSA